MDGKLIHEEAGVTTIEYVILLIIVVIGSLVAFQRFGDALDDAITTPTECIELLGTNQLR